MQPQTKELQTFLCTLNQEADTATAAFAALRRHPLASWSQVLSEHSEWWRFGTFEALLDEAGAELNNDAHRALTIVELVLPYLKTLRTVEGAELFKPLLRGIAFKQHAAALYRLEEWDKAFVSVQESLREFDDEPALAVERAAALLTYAQIQHERKKTPEALKAIREAAGIFESHFQFRRYEIALEVCGQILMDQNEYALAQEVYESARVTAERIDDPDALLRLDNNLGLCAVYLGQLDEARFRLTKALVGLQERGMADAVSRTVLNLAREAVHRNQLDDALETLHSVYASFLDRHMAGAAAQVLVELGDAVTGFTDDPAYARTTCHRLAGALASDEGAPRNLRAAVEYLRLKMETEPSIPALRGAFDVVRTFLKQFAGNSTTAFAVPR
jgi:tetratricopeptide (TPR) repeat protein